jgi:hypothetical protein
MSKTFHAIAYYRFIYPDHPVVMSIIIVTSGTLVWYFEFGSLVFICDLDFGAWKFHDFN